ncbi:MAG: collagen-like protein, partial [Gammaproteobacteria bacterium]|nr:collagen-like protein [Gammaproteobacteria bacterium]
DIQSGYQTADQYNENNRLIEEALENTVSRDGTTPNTLLADLDANSNSINNVLTTRTQVLYINGQQATVGAIGEKGEQGDPGADGIDGVDGIDGITGVDTIVDLTDTTISTPTEGQLMTWDGASKWINADPVVPPNSVVQVISVLDGEVSTGSAPIPWDDTIPQNTEGDEYIAASITPQSATNMLRIDALLNLRSSLPGLITVGALFQDTSVNAINAANLLTPGAVPLVPVLITHWMEAGTTSATTFKVRAGTDSASTLTLNGNGGNRYLGGVLYSSIIITEYKS